MRGKTSASNAAARLALAVAFAVALVAGRASYAGDASSAGCVPGAVAAAERAVKAVFGDDADVTFEDVTCSVAPGATQAAAAIAEPGSRTDGPVRFVLYADEDGRQRVGRLTARLTVAAPHVRARRALDAQAVLTGADVVTVRGAVGRVPLAPLPQPHDVEGATARRPLAEGTVLTSSSIAPLTLVRSGDEVVTVASVDGVEVRGRAVAAQSGHRGAIVIVVNPDSRRRLRGRVVGEALVEVLHVS